MPLPDVGVVQRNFEALDKLDDEKLIMVALSAIVMALSDDNFIPKGKGIALAAVLEKRSGVRSPAAEEPERAPI